MKEIKAEINETKQRNHRVRLTKSKSGSWNLTIRYKRQGDRLFKKKETRYRLTVFGKGKGDASTPTKETFKIRKMR